MKLCNRNGVRNLKMRLEPLAYLKVIEVGMRITAAGPVFFGLDEVNQALRGGGTVSEVKEGAVLTTRMGEDAESVQLALTGYSLKVVIAEQRRESCAADRKRWWQLW